MGPFEFLVCRVQIPAFLVIVMESAMHNLRSCRPEIEKTLYPPGNRALGSLAGQYVLTGRQNPLRTVILRRDPEPAYQRIIFIAHINAEASCHILDDLPFGVPLVVSLNGFIPPASSGAINPKKCICTDFRIVEALRDPLAPAVRI